MDSLTAPSVTSPLPARPFSDAEATEARRRERFYRPELDGLRFFAFLAIYLHHTLLFGGGGAHRRMPELLARILGGVGAAGAFGVDLFFVLSAYLITELLLRERQAQGTIDWKAFYARRMLRIWPLYFLYLAVARVLAFVVPGEEMTWGHLLGFALFSGNWVYIARPIATIAAPLWSVSVEEQFYILWPLAVRRGSVRTLKVIALTLLGIGLCTRLGLSLAGRGGIWISKNSFTRVDGIACGILLALMLKGGTPILSPALRGALLGSSLVCCVLLAMGLHLPEGAEATVVGMTFGWTAVALASTALVVAVLGDRGPGLTVLRSRPVVYLGRISYGLYVFHQLAMLGAEQLFPRHESSAVDWAGHFVLGLVFTVALAAASYRWLESPFLRLKQRFTVVASRPAEWVPEQTAGIH